MPRISDLQKIKNEALGKIKEEALAKLGTYENVVDGRSAAAYKRNIDKTKRIDVATKLLNQISAISIVKDTVGDNKVTTADLKAFLKNKSAPNQVLYKFVVDVIHTRVHKDNVNTESNVLATNKNKQPFEMTSRGVKCYMRKGSKKSLAEKIIYLGSDRPFQYELFKDIRVKEDEYSPFFIKGYAETFVNLETFLSKMFNIMTSGYDYFNVIENNGIIRVNDNLENASGVQRIDILMKNAVILRDCWLRYAKDISPKAYDATNNVCVYHQLTHFLLNPTSGKPTKFIDGKRVSENALYEFLKKTHPWLKKESGVSTTMIAMIGSATKRNVYAYDFDDKCFFKSTENNTDRNYCPILFYSGNGHMYLIDSKEAAKSIVEREKSNSNTAINTPSSEKEKEKKEVTVKHVENYFDGIACDGKNCDELEGGVYLLNNHSIFHRVIKFIEHYKITPKVTCKDNAIVSMAYLNLENKEVTIACDINYEKGGIVYQHLKRVADENGIDYVNEGIGAVVSKVVSKKQKQKREYLIDKMSLFASYENKCAICNLESEFFEIDHIIPLCSGGSNEIDNLQPLCSDCHRQKSEDERQSGEYDDDIDEHPEASYFNENVFTNVISSDNFKTWQFVERVSENTNDGDVKKIDMNKCRRNLLYYSKFEFPVFSVMDTVLEFDPSDAIKVGFYYIITENTFPFRGCGWYSHPLIELGLRDKIIGKNDIKFKLEASKVLPENHFQKHIDKLLEAFSSEPQLQKLCVNTYIGLMGRIKPTRGKSKFTLCKYEAANLLCEQNTFIVNHPLSDTVLYQSITTQDVLIENTMYPIYAQILHMEAMHLYETEKVVRSHGGIILDRNTDAIRYIQKTPIDITKYFWDDANTVQKYKFEDPPTPLMSQTKPQLKRKHQDDLFNTFNLDWNIQYDYETDATTKAAQVVDSGMSVHIDGRAGTGKSFLLREIIKVLQEKGLPYIAFSPTNKGARLINGVTIDSMYYGLKKNKGALNKFKNINVVIIDEVSMMQERFYNLFICIKKISPKTKFIIAGDFGQLPPVKDSWIGDYKNSAGLFELCNGNRLQLTKNRRSDSKLFDLAQNVQTIDISNFPVKVETYLNIAYRHETRKRVNKECLERFLDEEADPDDKMLFIPADPKNPKTQDVTLTIGIPVVCHTTRNNKKQKQMSNGFLNSERFEVQIIDGDFITLVGDGDREVQIKASEFHKYFYLGFCITIHTSQGETFKNKYTIYDWNFFYFCEKAKYVAVSRATSIENIQISN